MDLNMPIMNGFEATKEIVELINLKARTLVVQDLNSNNITQSKTWIIGLSAYNDAETISDAYKSGMDVFLSKPIKKASFFEKLEQLGMHI